MNRILLKGSKYGSLLSFFGFRDQDEVKKKTKTEQETQIESNETGWERLTKMFQTDEFNTLSPELSSVVHVGFMSAFSGALYGGIMSSRTAYMDFMKNNQATAFKDHLHAKKLLQDKVTLSFGKGAWNWSWRLTLFTTSYVTISTMISTYRGKHGILEHMLAGAATGFIYKFPVGPRAWVVGSALGLVMGTFAGTISYTFLTATGMSMEEVRYWQSLWQRQHNENWRKSIRAQVNEEERLLLNRESTSGAKGLENIPN